MTTVDQSTISPWIDVVFGTKNYEPLQSISYSPRFATAVSYVCWGTIFSEFKCEIKPPPPTIQNVTKAVVEFLDGFGEGVAIGLGFGECMKDLRGGYDNGI